MEQGEIRSKISDEDFGRALNEKEAREMNRKNIRLKVIGQKERLPETMQKKIIRAETMTKGNKGGIMNLAISYGGRAEILKAIKDIIKKRIPAEKLTEETINRHLWTAEEPYPDLIIRTGGELRLSNFLTWQSAYSELYFSEKYWPDFAEKDLDAAFEDFVRRKRNFGK